MYKFVLSVLLLATFVSAAIESLLYYPEAGNYQLRPNVTVGAACSNTVKAQFNTSDATGIVTCNYKVRRVTNKGLILGFQNCTIPDSFYFLSLESNDQYYYPGYNAYSAPAQATPTPTVAVSNPTYASNSMVFNVTVFSNYRLTFNLRTGTDLDCSVSATLVFVYFPDVTSYATTFDNYTSCAITSNNVQTGSAADFSTAGRLSQYKSYLNCTGVNGTVSGQPDVLYPPVTVNPAAPNPNTGAPGTPTSSSASSTASKTATSNAPTGNGGSDAEKVAPAVFAFLAGLLAF